MSQPTYVRAKVTGPAPIRDVLTRESVDEGGFVVLLVREPGPDLPRCPRHPKKGVRNAEAACLCHGTLIDTLVEQGAIGDVKPYDPAKPAAAKA